MPPLSLGRLGQGQTANYGGCMDALTLEKELLPGPVFVQHPDGSLVQGIPPGYVERTPPSTPRITVATAEAAMPLSDEVVKVLARHELFFLLLLLLELSVECVFEAIHMQYREDAILELSLIYPSLSEGIIRCLYWLAFMGESVYAGAFFTLGVLAAFKSRIRIYQRFSTVALAGTLGQLPLAYMNRFNLLIFFLRFIAYAYARFQWNLLYAITLVGQDLGL